MKVRKEALRAARLLLKGSLRDGAVDSGRVRELTARIVAEKPRRYVQILEAYQRLLKIELDKRHVVVESAQELDEPARQSLLQQLHQRFGAGLTSEFKTNPDLLGGMRVKVGSNIWDGTVRSRLESLRQQISA